MIEPDPAVFPNCTMELLALKFAEIDSDIAVFRRPLRASDANQCIGIFPSVWMPDERSQEMGRTNPGEPTVQRYHLTVQAFVKHMDEAEGSSCHSVLSGRIRSMLYRDAALRLGLTSLSFASDGVTERIMRWGITSQRFLSNEVQAAFLYLSTLEIWFETTSS